MSDNITFGIIHRVSMKTTDRLLTKHEIGLKQLFRNVIRKRTMVDITGQMGTNTTMCEEISSNLLVLHKLIGPYKTFYKTFKDDLFEKFVPVVEKKQVK